MKINQEQVNKLYEFTRAHFVEWYDVQTELVDHLANGIEQQWETNKLLTFDEALNLEFKKFGIFGFSELVEQKTKTLEKHYRKQVWTELKTYFKLPKIVITGFSVWGVFQLLNLSSHKDLVIIPLVLLLFVLVLFYAIKTSTSTKKSQKLTGKKWLFENVLAQMGGLIHFLNIGIYSPIFSSSNNDWGATSKIIFSGCFVLYAIIFYVSIYKVSPKLKHKFSNEFPEYKTLEIL